MIREERRLYGKAQSEIKTLHFVSLHASYSCTISIESLYMAMRIPMKLFMLLLLSIAPILTSSSALAMDDALGPEDSPVQSECRAQVTVTQTNAQPQPAYNATLFDYRADVTTDIKECAVVGFRIYTHTPRFDDQTVPCL
jgi:hypothetical protein